MAALPYPEQIEIECGPVRAIDLALYAAASGDHNPLHLDIEVARAAGFDRPVVHGMLTMAYVGRLLSQRFGIDALRSLSTRFVGAARLGETITLTATLSGVDESVVTYELHGKTASGEDLVTGTARVAALAR